MLSRKLWLWPFVVILGLVVYLVSCDGKATQPQPVPDDPKDYRVYCCDFAHNDDNWYIAYHPATNDIDSFYLPYSTPLVISADGKKMYVSNRERTVIAVVDLDSFVVVDQLPYKMAIAVSPDNQLIAVSGNGLHILRTSDYSEVFHDTDAVVRAAFSSNSQSFYGAVGNNVYKVDLSDTLFPVTRKSFSDGLVKMVVPSLDETKWFLYSCHFSDLYSFTAFDVLTDSIVFREYLSPGHGELEMTPNGSYVFYTNPGQENTAEGSHSIEVYDVAKNDIHKVISTVGILDPPYEPGIPISEVCITPDGRWLVAVASGEFSGFPFLLTLDISSMRFIIYRKLENGYTNLQSLVCHNSP